MRSSGVPVLALAVPGLVLGGGVPEVARFLLGVALGTGRYDVRLISLATQAGDPHSVRLTSPQSWLHGARTTRGTWEGYPFVHAGAVVAEFEFQRYHPRRALAHALDDCDAVQIVCGSPAWANAVLGLGRPVSLHVATRARIERRSRDANPGSALGWWRRAMTVATDRLDDRALRRVDAIQVMNSWMLDYARTLNAGRDVDIRHAPPGVDEVLFRPPPAGDQARDRSVLCVGRLGDPRKNVGMLLQAFALLPEAIRRDARLVLAGSSLPPPELRALAGALGIADRVEYVSAPSRDALVGLYQRAAAFALPSDEEGFGMVLLEAMACGLPVVATRCGGPEGIVRDAEDGFLVARDDVAAMADRLARLLGDRARAAAMGAQARRTVEARFALRVAGAAFVDVWDALLARAEKRRCVG